MRNRLTLSFFLTVTFTVGMVEASLPRLFSARAFTVRGALQRSSAQSSFLRQAAYTRSTRPFSMLPAICRSDRSDNGWGSNNGFTKKGRFLGVAAASVVCAQQEDAVQDKCADQHCAAQELIALYKKNKGIMYDSNFCKHVAEHLLALSDDDNGAALVCDIIRLEAQCKAQRNALGRQDTLEAEGVIASIVQKINDNIIDFATKKHCDEIVKDLYELGLVDHFDNENLDIHAVRVSAKKLKKTKLGRSLLRSLFKKTSSESSDSWDQIFKDIAEDPSDFSRELDISQCDQFSQEYLKRGWRNFDDVPSALLEETAHCFFLNRSAHFETDGIPTLSHVKDNGRQAHKALGRHYHVFRPMFGKALKKEKELSKNGYYVFYHGQKWSYRFYQRLQHFLYAVKTEKVLKDFIFMHFKDFTSIDSANEKAVRERLIAEGTVDCYTRNDPVLFLNWALLGNLNNDGCCSVGWVLCNGNARDVYLSVGAMFADLGYEDIYKQYEQELQDLEKEHGNLSDYGQLVLVAVPKNTVQKSVYYAYRGGYKGSLYVKDKSRTDDVKEVLDILHSSPQDVNDSNEPIFVLVMTQDEYGGANPDSGIKYYDFNMVDSKKLDAYAEKESKVFEKIKLALLKKQLDHGEKA